MKVDRVRLSDGSIFLSVTTRYPSLAPIDGAGYDRERDVYAYQEHASGRTLKEIGVDLGISGQRVRDLESRETRNRVKHMANIEKRRLRVGMRRAINRME